MEIVTIKTGYLEENCYLIKNNNDCLIIDPGDEADKIIEKIQNMNVVAIMITHNHFDHIGAVDELLKKYNIPIYTKHELKEGKHTIKDFNFEVIYNSGHSNDSISFYFENLNVIFVGDFIFKNSIGRWDLETGNYNEMIVSLKKFKDRFKDNKNLVIYPGHGDYTILEYELTHNEFLNNK